MSDALNHDGIRSQFCWSVQALALPASEQLAAFPPFVCTADELALEFDHWSSTALGNLGAEFTPARVELVAALDQRLSSMSRNGPEFTDTLWSKEGLMTHPSWDEVRRLAQALLASFGWPLEPPPPDRHAYIPGAP